MSSEQNSKRVRTSPTGDTPKQAAKTKRVSGIPIRVNSLERSPVSRIPKPSVSARGRKRLSFSDVGTSATSWSDMEEKAFVEIIMLSSDGKAWPATKNKKMWESAATFISKRSGLPLRTGLLLAI